MILLVPKPAANGIGQVKIVYPISVNILPIGIIQNNSHYR